MKCEVMHCSAIKHKTTLHIIFKTEKHKTKQWLESQTSTLLRFITSKAATKDVATSNHCSYFSLMESIHSFITLILLISHTEERCA